MLRSLIMIGINTKGRLYIGYPEMIFKKEEEEKKE